MGTWTGTDGLEHIESPQFDDDIGCFGQMCVCWSRRCRSCKSSGDARDLSRECFSRLQRRCEVSIGLRRMSGSLNESIGRRTWLILACSSPYVHIW